MVRKLSLLYVCFTGFLTAQHQARGGDMQAVFSVLRTTSQYIENPGNQQPFLPFSGSMTYLIYAPEQAQLYPEQADLSLRFLDSSLISRQLAASSDEPLTQELCGWLVTLLSPRYERFIRRSLPKSGYILIRQPSMLDGTLFPTSLGAFTGACGESLENTNIMHNISLAESDITFDFDELVVILAHEMAHRAREHLLEEHYAYLSCSLSPSQLTRLLHQQEHEADRIALLVLQEERYVKASLKKFLRELDNPYKIHEATGRRYRFVCTEATATHPAHEERIQRIVLFWQELLMKQQEISEDEACVLVHRRYCELIAEMKLEPVVAQWLERVWWRT